MTFRGRTRVLLALAVLLACAEALAEPAPVTTPRTATLPPPRDQSWFDGNLNGVRLYADEVIRPLDAALYQRVDGDLAELEADRRLAWMMFGGGIALGVATMAYPIVTESGCKERVAAVDVQQCENQRFSMFAIPATLFAATGVILWSTMKPSKEDVVDVVRTHGLRSRAGLTFDARPEDGYYAGGFRLHF